MPRCSRCADETQLVDLRRLLARAALLPTGPADFEVAASRYRTCRRRRETVRRLIDCPIATVPIREDIAVLHAGADFDVLARHTALRLDPL